MDIELTFLQRLLRLLFLLLVHRKLVAGDNRWWGGACMCDRTETTL